MPDLKLEIRAALKGRSKEGKWSAENSQIAATRYHFLCRGRM
jgi:hypothetical protein